MIAHGGLTPARVCTVPISAIEDGEKILADIARRRLAHGYKRHDAGVTSCTAPNRVSAAAFPDLGSRSAAKSLGSDTR